MTNFWREAACDDITNRVSSSRVISLAAGLTLSIATLALTAGSFWFPAMLGTLTAFGPSLAGLAAMNYGINKWTSGAKND